MTNNTPMSEAHDPHTTAARLAELAADYPETRVAIVSHPAVYPDLLTWLSEYGDNDVRAAIAQHAAAAAAPPVVTPPPPPVPEVAATPTVASPPVATTPAAPVAPPLVAERHPGYPGLAKSSTAPEGSHPGYSAQEVAASAKVKKAVSRPSWLTTKNMLIAGAAVVAVLVVVIAAIALPSLFGGGDKIRVAEFGSAPAASTWTVDNPFAKNASEDDYLGVDSTTIGQDLALVMWSKNTYDYNDDSEYSYKMSLLNTRNGSEVWTIAVPKESEYMSGNSTQGRVLFRDYDNDEYHWTVYSLADGSTIAEADDLSFVGAPNSLGGDFIGAHGDKLSRYSLDTLKPVWTVSTAGDTAYLGVETVILGFDVYSISDGSKRSWKADESDMYTALGGYLLSVTRDGDSYDVSRINEINGEQLWTLTANSQDFLPMPDIGAIVEFNRDEGTVSLIRMEDGKPAWTIDAEVAENGYMSGGSKEAGIVILPIGGSNNSVTVLDLNSGEKLYKLRVSDDGSYGRTLLTITDKTIYMLGSKGELIALDSRSGVIKWTLKAPKSGSYGYQLWGGNFVAVNSLSGADDSGKRRAALLGVG